MNRLLVATAIASILVGVLAGYLWWGLPHSRLQGELHGAQTNADRAGQQLDALRAERERLETQLKSERSRREAAESDLLREKAQSARLQSLISEKKK